MPSPFNKVQIHPEAVAVLCNFGIKSMDELADANVTELQTVFVQAASEGRYPEKYPSLVKIAAWVEQARNFAARQPQGGPSTDLENIPLAVVKRPNKAQRKRRQGSRGSQIKQVELRPDRHRLRKNVNPDRQTPAGGSVDITPRADEAADPVAMELNPETQRTLQNRRSAGTPLQQSTANQTSQTAPPVVPAQQAPPQPAPIQAPPEPEPCSANVPNYKPGFRSFDDYKEGRVAVKPLDRHSLTLGEDTSKDTGSEQDDFEYEQVEKRKMPRTHARGVKHPAIFKVFFGAFITLMAVTLTILTAIGCLIFPIYLEQEYKQEFVILFVAALVFGLIYMFVAVDARCRVCSCHLFYSRRCLKHVKAHRILGGFPMVAQTIHILLFHWFRCMYCGTAIRLKDES